MEYIKRYNTEKYDQVIFRVPRGNKDKIKYAADQEGMSMNAYIMSAVEEKMNSTATRNA